MTTKKRIVYLTGGIATGKTTVANLFKEFGARVVDADKIVHRIMDEDPAIKQKIVEYFGQDILDQGKINRRKVGSIVFKDKDKLRFLEELLHPRVLEEMAQEVLEAKEDIVVLEIPLLFEKKLNLKPVVLVYCPREIQIDRLRRRDGLSDDEIENRLSAQIDIEEKRKLADYIIDNSKDIDHTKEQVRHIFEILASEEF